MDSIGQRLQKARLARGLSTTELAKMVGLTQPAIANYERDKRRVSIRMMEKLSAALDLPVDYLLGHAEAAAAMTERLKLLKRAGKGVGYRETIRKRREELGWSQEHLAQQMATSAVTISRWENGRRIPNNRQFARIERLLGLPLGNRDPWQWLQELSLAVPKEWPEGLLRFIGGANGQPQLGPKDVAFVAAMAQHPRFWRPASDDDWGELVEAYRWGIGERAPSEFWDRRGE